MLQEDFDYQRVFEEAMKNESHRERSYYLVDRIIEKAIQQDLVQAAGDGLSSINFTDRDLTIEVNKTLRRDYSEVKLVTIAEVRDRLHYVLNKMQENAFQQNIRLKVSKAYESYYYIKLYKY